ncbi:MAG: methyltransferase domain-containing protein, partial [Planctomycetes bacterium]|nr:methyltransferase domain-containing protein [Planctomycetota bacterium]
MPRSPTSGMPVPQLCPIPTGNRPGLAAGPLKPKRSDDIVGAMERHARIQADTGDLHMRHLWAFRRLAPTLVAVCLLAGAGYAQKGDPGAAVKEIVPMNLVPGGLVVHLGCGDGTLTAALRVNDRYMVHGLEADPALVARARDYLKGKGLYGPVSVEQFSGTTLPYTDNLINLLVAQNPGAVPMAEMLRVLVPGGVVRLQRDGQWFLTRKEWPDNIDEWGHFLHDASNNAVAKDSVVGPPRSLQWVAPPLWLRSHETPSGIQACVSAGGRLFYIFDEGLIGITDERLPERWSLLCRDAFNGKLLWRRPLEPWGWPQWSPDRYQGKDWTTLTGNRTNVPEENQRRLVADGERLYATLGYGAALSILEAATGRVLTTVPATQGTREILVSEGIAVAYTRQGDGNKGEAALVAVEGRSGNVLWQRTLGGTRVAGILPAGVEGVPPSNRGPEALATRGRDARDTTAGSPAAKRKQKAADTSGGAIRPLSWAIDHARIVYLSGRTLAALRLNTGENLWTAPADKVVPRTLVTVQDVIVMHDAKSVAAYDATNGELLWDKTVPPIAGAEGDDLFVVDGLVWRGIACVNEEGKPVNKSAHALAIGWDLRTGEEKKRILVNNLRSPEHHHRCYRNKATERYLISSYEGAEFLDFQGDNHGQNNWIRGACKYGMVPCNGMLYVPPDQCFCQPGGKLLGYTALKATPGAALRIVADEQRLEKGPAYGSSLQPSNIKHRSSS